LISLLSRKRLRLPQAAAIAAWQHGYTHMTDTPHASGSTDARVLRIAPQDNIGVVTTAIDAGESILIAGRPVTLFRRIPTGHKIALAPVAGGEKVIKYGAAIGSATCDIRPGDYVHTHNLKSDYLPTYTLDGSNPYLRQ
jgi:altronate dehydratase